MAATKYRILCKYSNDVTKVILKNDPQDEYIQTEEFYTEDHRIITGTDSEKLEEEKKKQDFIINGNDASNVKNSMLFGFGGTKRINHKKWVDKKIGYVLRDYSSIINKISPAGDYSGEYVMVGGDSIKTATIVAKKNPISEVKTLFTRMTDNKDLTKQQTYNGAQFTVFDSAKLNDYIIQSTIAKLNTNGEYEQHSLEDTTKLNSYYNYGSGSSAIQWVQPYYPNATIVVDTLEIQQVSSFRITNGSYYTGYAYTSLMGPGAKFIKNITIKPEQVETIEIPGHYEEVADPPFLIKDSYFKIDGEPWFTFARVGSLTDAIEKAEKIVKAIGISNVKIIKEVPFDQKLRIR